MPLKIIGMHYKSNIIFSFAADSERVRLTEQEEKAPDYIHASFLDVSGEWKSLKNWRIHCWLLTNYLDSVVARDSI